MIAIVSRLTGKILVHWQSVTVMYEVIRWCVVVKRGLNASKAMPADDACLFACRSMLASSQPTCKIGARGLYGVCGDRGCVQVAQ